MSKSRVVIAYDFICPWCWIAERRIQSALQGAGLVDGALVSFVPFELNPQMPQHGMERKAYRSTKFGSWARSQQMDAQVTAVGRQDGLEFNYERIDRTPNTLLAHRLVWFAQQSGDATELVDAIFAAYFRDGMDIGSAAVLTPLAAAVGLNADEVGAFLASDEGVKAVRALESDVIALGVTSVPATFIGSSLISGAQPLVTFANALAGTASKASQGL